MSVAKPLIIVALALLLGCSPATPPTAPGGPARSDQQPRAPAAQTTYDDPAWKALVEAARQEGRLVLATGPTPETRLQLPAAFKERFGVEIEYIGGRSADLTTRLQGERAAGVYTIDVAISGADSAVSMFLDGWLDPVRPLLVVPEVRDPSVYLNNRFPFIDPQEQYLFELNTAVTGNWVVNPQVVPDGAIRTLDDLLDPRWKGKISIEDPTVAGQGLNEAVYLYLLKGEDFFRRLYVDQDPGISRDDRQMSDWLARGTYPITIGIDATDVDALEREGLPVKVLGTLDGPGWTVGGFSVMSLFNQAPHPNAAKLFLNWMASPDGMGTHAGSELRVPLRKDVPHPWVRAHQVPKEGVRYINLYEYQYITEQKPAILRRIRELLGR
jgi:ABC-type Fe3+ transport system substrate-binding protein